MIKSDAFKQGYEDYTNSCVSPVQPSEQSEYKRGWFHALRDEGDEEQDERLTQVAE